MNAQEKQGFRMKTAPAVCQYCKHIVKPPDRFTVYTCGIGGFDIEDRHLCTCKKHDWR